MPLSATHLSLLITWEDYHSGTKQQACLKWVLEAFIVHSHLTNGFNRLFYDFISAGNFISRRMSNSTNILNEDLDVIRHNVNLAHF
jgi:hypothetical protein